MKQCGPGSMDGLTLSPYRRRVRPGPGNIEEQIRPWRTRWRVSFNTWRSVLCCALTNGLLAAGGLAGADLPPVDSSGLPPRTLIAAPPIRPVPRWLENEPADWPSARL